jgi:hypothetical protein
MTGTTFRSWSALLCAFCLTGVVRSNPATGFADLPRLVTSHPLHGVLAGYDREIAALRATQSVPGLVDAGARTERAIAALRGDAAAAQLRARNVASAHAGVDRAQENAALAEIIAWRDGAEGGTTLYDAELDRETDASLTAFERATAQRNERAYAARQQELHERELGLAYALARRDAAQHLSLRLKLGELHPLPATRRTLEAELSALDARESTTIDAARRNDGAILTSYSSELQRAEARANARMAAQLRAKARANLNIRRSVSQAESNARGVLPSFAQRLALFRSSYRLAADAGSLVDGFRTASADVANRFETLAATDRESRRATAVQIQRLEDDRAALYRSIVAQIVRTANRLGQERHLKSVRVGGASLQGSVDLTAAVRDELARSR